MQLSHKLLLMTVFEFGFFLLLELLHRTINNDTLKQQNYEKSI